MVGPVTNEGSTMSAIAVVSVSPFRGATGLIGTVPPRTPLVNLETRGPLVASVGTVKSSLGTGTVLDISV